MKRLTKKDWIIIILFFLLVFTAMSFALSAMVFKDISYQQMLTDNVIMLIFSYFGYILIYPVMVLFVTPIHFLSLLGFSPAVGEPLAFLPLVASLIYSSMLLFCLGFWNDRSLKKTVSLKK